MNLASVWLARRWRPGKVALPEPGAEVGAQTLYCSVQTLLEPLLEAKEKRNDAAQLEDALAARPGRRPNVAFSSFQGLFFPFPGDFFSRCDNRELLGYTQLSSSSWRRADLSGRASEIPHFPR